MFGRPPALRSSGTKVVDVDGELIVQGDCRYDDFITVTVTNTHATSLLTVQFLTSMDNSLFVDAAEQSFIDIPATVSRTKTFEIGCIGYYELIGLSSVGSVTVTYSVYGE